VIMITAVAEPRAARKFFRSIPLKPRHVNVGDDAVIGRSPSPVRNSSTDANWRAPYPNESSEPTSAIRKDSSSSITAIRSSLDTFILVMGRV
jgi:hypothetical protein